MDEIREKEIEIDRLLKLGYDDDYILKNVPDIALVAIQSVQEKGVTPEYEEKKSK